MRKAQKIQVVLQFLLLVTLIILFSFISTVIFKREAETIPENQSLVFQDGITVAEFGQQNNLSEHTLEEVFPLESAQDMQKLLSEFELSQDEISQRVDKAQALSAEHESKNWLLILSKFALWFVFLGVVFTLMRQGRITTQVRKSLYLVGLVLFGVILGSSPSPMGTVKDGIALLGSKGVIFPPRMIALTVFLIMVFVANKFICSWGCQFGTLQDLIFRLNRNRQDTKGIFKQYKLPFVVTNTIRVGFFILFTLVAFLWSTDMIEFIDPFKIYNPTVVSSTGWLFLSAILVGSLFVYRPWCTLFCPFGLVGWLVEKVSIFKINVDYDTCYECDACVKACPSTAMNAILKQKQVIPDCFACSSCIDICPVNSIQLRAGKRNSPPADMFTSQGPRSKRRKQSKDAPH